MSRIIYLKSAFKSLEKQDTTTRMRLIEAIDRIPQGDVKRLQGDKYLPVYRLRVGKYRIIYHFEEEKIIIVDIDTRGDIYK
ncbi:MAG: type II toxin-antitoxin system RelE family toxin [Candidatus Alkaliphilus sp. MAG34]